jgi:Holliday junction resolvase RusA-like endonuclease
MLRVNVDALAQALTRELRRALVQPPALAFTVEMNPGDLAVNSAYRSGRDRRGRVRVRKSVRFAAARALVGESALLAALRGRLEPLGGPVRVVLRCYWATPGTSGLGRGDVDGPIKGALDSLEEAGVFADDAQIDRIEVEKFVDPDRPRIEVEVWRSVQDSRPLE